MVGVDLSGNEDLPIIPEVRDFFIRAKHEFGLGITIHAGETGKIENIVWAIDDCEADRISHGLAAAKSEKVMNQLRDKDICLEVCLVSNFLTSSVSAIDEHPVNEFIKNKVPFVFCSDNPCINTATLSENYKLFCDINVDNELISAMYEQQQKYAFNQKK